MKAIHAVNAVLWQPGEQIEIFKQTNKQTDRLLTRGRPRASGNKQTYYYTRGRPRAPRVKTNYNPTKINTDWKLMYPNK